MTFPVPYGRSQMGMRGSAYKGGYSFARVAGSCASLNVGLADFAFILDLFVHSLPTNATYPIVKDAGGTGYDMYLWSNGVFELRGYSGGGLVFSIDSPAATIVEGARSRIVIFADRDANGYMYLNGNLVRTVDISGGNVDLDNAGNFQALYNSADRVNASPDMWGCSIWNFGVDGLPDATDRAQIVAEAQANPYAIPPTLESRPAFATELRLCLDFADQDPAATAVTDKSAYGNDMTIAGGAAWSAVGKEMKAPTRILTPDGGPTYGLRDGFVDQTGLSGIAPGTQDFVIEILVKDYIQDEATSIKLGAPFPAWLYWADDLFTVYSYVFNDSFLGGGSIVAGTTVLGQQIYNVGPMFKGTLHMFLIFRAASYSAIVNGHLLRTSAKAAHDRAYTRLQLFNWWLVGGIATPSIGSILRLYIGDFSGFSDADLLAIHRGYLSCPYETPAELAAYEAFRFTGRMPDGSQIPSNSAVVYNEAPLSPGYGETLAIQGGLTWADVRSAVHV